jgi:predicted GNAT family N-acyltransferase
MGVGTLFLQKLITEAKRLEPHGAIALDTQTLPNTRFYAKSGFVLVSEVEIRPAGLASLVKYPSYNMRLDLAKT